MFGFDEIFERAKIQTELYDERNQFLLKDLDSTKHLYGLWSDGRFNALLLALRDCGYEATKEDIILFGDQVILACLTYDNSDEQMLDDSKQAEIDEFLAEVIEKPCDCPDCQEHHDDSTDLDENDDDDFWSQFDDLQ